MELSESHHLLEALVPLYSHFTEGETGSESEVMEKVTLGKWHTRAPGPPQVQMQHSSTRTAVQGTRKWQPRARNRCVRLLQPAPQEARADHSPSHTTGRGDTASAHQEGREACHKATVELGRSGGCSLTTICCVAQDEP